MWSLGHLKITNFINMVPQRNQPLRNGESSSKLGHLLRLCDTLPAYYQEQSALSNWPGSQQFCHLKFIIIISKTWEGWPPDPTKSMVNLRRRGEIHIYWPLKTPWWHPAFKRYLEHWYKYLKVIVITTYIVQ